MPRRLQPETPPVSHNETLEETSCNCPMCLRIQRERERQIEMVTCFGCRLSITRYASFENNGNPYCSQCQNTLFYWCPECGEYHRRNEEDSDCEPSEELTEDTESQNDIENLESWNFKPFYKRFATASDSKEEYTIGFELEIEVLGRGALTNCVEALQEFPYLFAKEDGSIAGFEIVSHPCTLAFLCEERERLNGLFSEIVGYGGRAYQAVDSCGIHVHIDRETFGSFHLYKFLSFVYKNPDFTLLISQRVKDLLGRWASLTDDEQGTLAQKAKLKFTGHNFRYAAVNLENVATVELRIFRSTLRPKSFFKCLEYTVAAVEFTRSHSATDLQADTFVEWVRSGKEYPELAAFLSVAYGER